MTVQDQTTQGIVLTGEAASKVKALLEQEGRDDLQLRVAVQPGGCSGLRYQLFFDERSLDGDVVTEPRRRRRLAIEDRANGARSELSERLFEGGSELLDDAAWSRGLETSNPGAAPEQRRCEPLESSLGTSPR